VKAAPDKGKMWRISAVPVALVGSGLIAVTIVQTFFFHSAFVFGDSGITLQTGTNVNGNEKLAGMITTPVNAESLSELTAFIEESELTGSSAIVWDQAPILYYVLDIDCAIGHFWPSLDSYPYAEFAEDIECMEKYPLVIYQTIYYEDLIKGMPNPDQKTQRIIQLLQEGSYEEAFRNAHYVVCLPGQRQ